MATAAALKTSLSQFANSLYDKIVQKQGNNPENVILSPLSIYTAFMMTMAGADGHTKEEIMDALQLPKPFRDGDPHERVGPMLLKFFQNTPGVELSLANRLFLIKQLKLEESFSQSVQKSYHAEAEQLSALPNLEEKRKRVNTWVSQQTRNKINDLIPSGGLPQDCVLALINALYFRGAWDDAFEKENTHSETFHCLNGSTMKVQMMYKEAEYSFVELADEDAQALKMPFKGSDWEMLIVLPNDNKGLPKLMNELRKPGKLASILSSDFEKIKVELHLPRFKVEDKESLDLKQYLISMGMKSVFDHSANMTKLSKEKNLFIQSAFHKAMLEVDEEGATAAAASGMIAVPMCLIQNPVFRVDHPFFVALVHDQTVPVFVGHVTNPESH